MAAGEATDTKAVNGRQLRVTIRAYILPRLGPLSLAKIDAATLNAFYGELLTDGRTGRSGLTGGLAPKSVRNVHGLLHRAFRDAVRWRRLMVNPCDAADQPRKATPEMRAWSSAELGRFITFTEPGRAGGVWRLLATTVMRRGELLGLRWADVDLDAGRLTIRQTMTTVGDRPEVGSPKTSAGARRVSIDADTVTALLTWRRGQAAERLMMGGGWQGGHNPVVTEPDGSPVHPQVLTRRLQSITKRAGLLVVRLHDVRHSYATAARPHAHETVGLPTRRREHVLTQSGT